AAGPAVDAVAAVAGIPDERVVAVAELGGVVAAPADDEVTAVTADERVVALAAGDGVVAGAAVDGQPDHIGRQAARVDRVIAVAAFDREKMAGLGIGRRHLLGEPGRGDGGAHVGAADLVVASRAVDGHRVGRAVAGALSVAEIDRHLRHAGAGEVADGDVVGPALRGGLNLLD